jgi:hypothetical protein
MVAQGLFDRRLREHHAGGVAERVGFWDHVDAPDQLALGPEVLRGRERGHVGQDAFGHAEVVEETKDFVIDGNSARLVVDGAETVNRQRAHAMAPEQARCNGAGGTGANHDNLIVIEAFVARRGHAGTPPWWSVDLIVRFAAARRPYR